MTSSRDSSRVVLWLAVTRATFSRWTGHSTVGRSLSRVGDAVDAAGEPLGRWARASWLLGPPNDPEVVVIDLRETYTVGPLLCVLDRLAATLGPRWRNSLPARWLERAATATVAAPVRVAGLVLLAMLLGSLLGTVAAGGLPSGWSLIAAGLALLGTRERRSAAALRDSAVGRALTALLVPPEPPEGA